VPLGVMWPEADLSPRCRGSATSVLDRLRSTTRYEKTARAYLSMLCIASARLWIKTVYTAKRVLGH
jgi:hypothetical protein